MAEEEEEDRRGREEQQQQQHVSHSGRIRLRPESMNSIRLSQSEVETIMENFAQEDNYRAKTWTRRVVENFLSKYKWYFPRKDDENGPSLIKAYAYYEHITLPRRVVGEQNADHVYRRAEPGEKVDQTELFCPFTTPARCFIEWGIGIDLYFSSLRIMSVVLFLAGLINIHNIDFYRSAAYSPDGRKNAADVPFSLQGSAVCTTGDWVVCSDCTEGNFDSEGESTRFGRADDGTVLVLRNGCNGADLPQGMVNYATFFFLVVVILIVTLYLRAREIRSDEDKVTSTDYSVCVKNPPPEAYDPDEWRDFFDQFAESQVTVVTVALNNDQLLRKLVARRIHKNNLRRMLPKETDMEDESDVRVAVDRLVREQQEERRGCMVCFLECTLFPVLRLFGWFLKPETLVDKIFKLKGEIEELQKDKYNVSTVFVTFETEEGQRSALAALSAGRLDILMNNHAAVPGTVFHNTVLEVVEPTEPNAVRWLDLTASRANKIITRIVTLAVTLGVVALCGWLVLITRENWGPGYSGPLITIFNSIIPLIVKLLMIFERHTTEGSWQTSLYLKITIFRWINTAILTKIITPFTSTLSPDKTSILPTINSILWSELWLSPVLRLLDIMGNFGKHVLAPRARNQELMNLNFQGTYYNLGERYTDLTKVLFVVFFYSALFPASFFFGTAILIVQYFTDKFCLLRIWGWSPFLGNELARFSRRYFFSGSLLAFCLISAYAWAQFPYDNVCDPTTNVTTGVAGTYPAVTLLDKTILTNVVVTQDTAVVYCDQHWRDWGGEYENFPFPPLPSVQPDGMKWMTESQETLTGIYGVTSVVVVIVFLVSLFGLTTLNYVISWCRGIYQPNGQTQRIDFSSNKEIFAYVPQVKVGGFPFPFLACDIDQLDQGLIGWNDPLNSYDYHNMIFDVPYPNMPRKKIIEGNTRNHMHITEHEDYAKNSQRLFVAAATAEEQQQQQQPQPPRRAPLFAVVKHYPTKWQKELMECGDGDGDGDGEGNGEGTDGGY